MLPLVVQHAVKPRAFAANPDRAIVRRRHRQRDAPLPIVRRDQRFRFSRTQRDEAVAAGAHPQRAFAVFIEAPNPVAGKTVGVIEMQNGPVGKQQVKAIARRAHRQSAGLGFQQRHEFGVVEICAAIFRDRMAIPFHHLIFTDDPQTAIAAGADPEHIITNALGIIGVRQQRQPAIFHGGQLSAAGHP